MILEEMEEKQDLVQVEVGDFGGSDQLDQKQFQTPQCNLHTSKKTGEKQDLVQVEVGHFHSSLYY